MRSIALQQGRQNKNGKRIRKCRFRFVWTSDLPKMNFFSNVITFATELYATVGISLRTISKKFKEYKEYFNIKINADETYIKIKGKGFWLWIIYCKESKHVIA